MWRSFVAVVATGCCSVGLAQPVSPLFARGYTVVPQPQRVLLLADDFTVGKSWHFEVGKSVALNDVAVETLQEDLMSRFNLSIRNSGGQGDVISLHISPDSIHIGNRPDVKNKALEDQAYRINLRRDSISITGNTSTGLFYGVETLLQLLKVDEGALWLPEGTIEDWPNLQLRLMYWDDAHHLEHVDELKRELRQAAFYKVNGFELKLDGHFQFKSAPAVVEPYALTPGELQDLTNYGLRYHVQLIPYLDGPGHIAFVLKHREYAHLRAFPDNNYEMCVANPETYKLLEGMYQDMLDANKGVNYFYISMDEPYYLGLAHNSQCNETSLDGQPSSPGQLFAHFVNTAGGYLHDRHRTVMFWGAYPLTPSDVSRLSPYLIGNMYGPNVLDLDRAIHQRGLHQIISTTYINSGDSRMFPQYVMLPPTERLHSESYGIPDLVGDITSTITANVSRVKTDLMGEVTSGWGDKGINPEAFWLGYIAGSSAGWHLETPNVLELTSDFYSLFYGPRVVSMDRIYQLMSEQDQLWSDSWDTTPSTSRKGIWGGAYGKIYDPRKPAQDQVIPLPPSPGNDLQYESTWSADNAKRLALAFEAEQSNDSLLGLLGEDMQRAQFNRYNLEVYSTIAKLYRQGFTMIEGIHEIDRDLALASRLREHDPKAAINQIDNALDVATSIWRKRNQVLADSVATWDKSWFPRVADANGRHFVHEMDDVKDHMADRTTDMSYLVYRERILPFGGWVNAIATARNHFATTHHLPVREYTFSWDDFGPVGSSEAITKEVD